MEIGNISFETQSLERVKLWQYNEAERLLGVLDAEISFAKSNISEFFENWERDVFNIDTAGTFGLEVWGINLGVSRPYQDPENFSIDSDGDIVFLNSQTGLWHKIFASGENGKATLALVASGSQTKARILVDNEVYRRFLKGRLFLYNSNGSMPDIIKYLEMVFPGKPVYALNGLDMTVTVVFAYQPSKSDLALIQYPDFLPLPAGVELKLGVADLDKTFGFNGSGLTGFDTGTFFN